MEKLYKQRMREREKEGLVGEEVDESDEMDWDPIEDVVEDNRNVFLGIVHTYFWKMWTYVGQILFVRSCGYRYLKLSCQKANMHHQQVLLRPISCLQRFPPQLLCQRNHQ